MNPVGTQINTSFLYRVSEFFDVGSKLLRPHPVMSCIVPIQFAVGQVVEGCLLENNECAAEPADYYTCAIWEYLIVITILIPAGTACVCVLFAIVLGGTKSGNATLTHTSLRLLGCSPGLEKLRSLCPISVERACEISQAAPGFHRV